jgi:putative DNA primase/helicase
VPWDGVSRLERFYATVVSKSPIKAKLMRKWMIQAVAAAFSPDGIAGQGILTFVGPQNIGKTTWFQRLAPPELDVILTGHTLDLKSKDSIFIVLTYWVVELGELDATFQKSVISALKAFITQLVDKIRRPYAAVESCFGRRTVFGGSVNEPQFLADKTGSRRVLTVPADGFKLDEELDMQQVWAEFQVIWAAGESFNLSMEDVAELAIHNEDFTTIDPIEERIAAGFDWEREGNVQGNLWEWVTATEALMRVGVKDPTRAEATSASFALRKLNGNQGRKSNGRHLLAVPATFVENTG